MACLATVPLPPSVPLSPLPFSQMPSISGAALLIVIYARRLGNTATFLVLPSASLPARFLFAFKRAWRIAFHAIHAPGLYCSGSRRNCFCAASAPLLPVFNCRQLCRVSVWLHGFSHAYTFGMLTSHLQPLQPPTAVNRLCLFFARKRPFPRQYVMPRSFLKFFFCHICFLK